LNRLGALILVFIFTIIPLVTVNAADNLIEDPSFELIKAPNQFGMPFVKWTGWKYDGESEFAVGHLGYRGKNSALLVGKSTPKIRIWQEHILEPGRYRITAYLRGLDISTGQWGQTTELAFNNQYMQLNKNGTFGWSKILYVAEIKEKTKTMVSFGLMAPGFLWIDDITLEKVGEDVPLTAAPVLGLEDAPIVPPGQLSAGAVNCPFCGYKNMPAWKSCYACGTPLESTHTHINKPLVKTIASFEQNNPFNGGTVILKPVFEGKKVLRIDKSYISLERQQDWSGYDYLKMDLYSEAKESFNIDIEISDSKTQDYWTRVNYTTSVLPGKSTLVIPLKQLYMGEKSRPGRALDLNSVTRFILNIGNNPKASLFLKKMELVRDDSAQKVQFEGLFAFDFGTGSSPLMEGFTAIGPATLYSKGRGYGLKNAKIWRTFDALQPDPLYQDYMCIESGGLAVDLPNGTYRVFVNIDNPSGYWGEYQIYKKRTILAQGKPVLNETMDFNTLKNKYFRFWNIEDLPTDDTFDKYQKTYFHEKIFDVEVIDGQLYLEFQGEDVANSVSAVVIYPVSKAVQGKEFLKWVENKRRFYFDNSFKRVLHMATGDPLNPSAGDKKRGYIVFHRDPMLDLYPNDTPFKNEIDKSFSVESFAGQIEPLTLSILPLRDLGQVKVQVSELSGPAGIIPATAIDTGYVSNRISRVTMEGSVYTLIPRLIMPSNTIGMPKDVARRFWLTIHTPVDAKPGVYQGKITLTSEHGESSSVPIAVRIRKGTLDLVDLPVGPFGYTIDTPWYADDKEALAFNHEMTLKSLLKMREYGFTLFSGMPTIQYNVVDGKQSLDFGTADADMALAKNLGFLAVNTYGAGLRGVDSQYEDSEQLKNSGISNYSAFVKVIYDAIQQHAQDNQWLPVYWNLVDEPVGDDLLRSIKNVQAYRDAFPKGPPFFTGASSFKGNAQNSPHFKLANSFHVVSLNDHDEEGVRLLQKNGTDWAFYNGANRWTYGEYLYKAAKQFDMKFRLSWHWNISAGDPYYALDSREDDYAWFHTNPSGQLIPEVSFERLAMGLVDYRMLLTLKRLAKEQKGTAAAIAAEEIIATRLSKFKLGQRDHDTIYSLDDWLLFRHVMADAIESLEK
jgi:hypothetical protein